jgi:hypothetical protein
VAQPGLKRGTFSPDLLVLVATTETKGPYQPGLKIAFLLVAGGGGILGNKIKEKRKN